MIQEIENGQRRAIEPNPQFAPAYAQLANLYARQSKSRQERLALAQKAIQLQPSAAWLLINLGHILLRMDRVDEARKAGERGLAVSQAPEEKNLALSFLQSVRFFYIGDIGLRSNRTQNLDKCLV